MRIKGLPIIRSGTALPFRADDGGTDTDPAATTEEGTIGRMFPPTNRMEIRWSFGLATPVP